MPNLSVAEAMGSIYGKEVRLLTAICGILGTIGGIAVQFKVFGNIFNYFLGIDPTYSIFLASSIVILYSSLGGIKAVTYTDIMQFVTFGFVIPLIGIILWNHIGNTNISFSATNDPNFDYKKVLDFTSIKFWEMIPLILYFAMPTIDSMDFQRISMGRNIIQVKKAWLIAAGLLIVVTLLLAWIPFLVKNIDPNLQADQVVNYVAANFTSTGLKGLVIIGIASMAMSTADSRINAASVLFANDIGKVFDIKINELILSKLFSLTLGIFAIYLALSKTDLLKRELKYFVELSC
jgi:Na+/proline symporter